MSLSFIFNHDPKEILWMDQKLMPSQIQNQIDVLQNEECISKHKHNRKTYRSDDVQYKPGKAREIRLGPTLFWFALLFGSPYDPEALRMACHLPSHLLLFSHLSRA